MARTNDQRAAARSARDAEITAQQERDGLRVPVSSLNRAQRRALAATQRREAGKSKIRADAKNRRNR